MSISGGSRVAATGAGTVIGHDKVTVWSAASVPTRNGPVQPPGGAVSSTCLTPL